ncbi:hypothetical protein BDZ90DRAFT_229280 [Jaminaea rosea]|uniref:Uncharacterized protein n=1 Tax=Jaminaea rosea TaxID=1569628 RepID=A0A316UY78_9BASI|nr:hypothetical protein BDZ90DRAFT_229280 [Jaminaea rosea]PWN30266.1 hypothetical protein BDZ90DRAFT_229280 [Jaminaea rosea]
MPIIARKDKDDSPLSAKGVEFTLLSIFPRKGGGSARAGGSVHSIPSSSSGRSSSHGVYSGSSSSPRFIPPGSSGRSIPYASRSSVGYCYGNGCTAGRVGSYNAATSANAGVPRGLVPAPLAFQGRPQGGVGRSDIYGTARYGSGITGGYSPRPSYAGGTTAGYGFPFVYWPVSWPGYPDAGYYGSGAYNRTDRPGGAISVHVLGVPPGVNQTSNNFMLYGDANSNTAILKHLVPNCNVTWNSQPLFGVNPRQAVQYYRGSSYVLLLQGYNNSQPDSYTTNNATVITTPVTPLPSTVNMTYFNCLNRTLGMDLPLPYEDSAGTVVKNAALGMAGEPMMALQTAWVAILLVVLVQLLGR